ncbi:MAG: calcium-binding protein [Bacillota bacterium]
MIEALENRALMDAVMDHGALTVTGTDAADVITIRQQGNQLIVDQQSNRAESSFHGAFDMSDMYVVRVQTLGGNDQVRVDTTYTPFVFQIDGGRGNDELIGGSAMRNYLYGGDGNDTLVSLRSDGSLDGGAGNDRLIGGRGENVFRGGDGNDELIGEGDDYMHGGNGNDVLRGGDNSDRMYGEAGNDRLYGGGGPDRLSGGDGHDFGDGGSGTDWQDGTLERFVSIP